MLALSTLLVTAALAVTVPDRIAGEDLGTRQPVAVRLDAKPSVVLFLSAKCPCSGSHQEPLKEIAKEFGEKGFRFVAVHSNSDESLESARTHFAAAKLPFPVVHDPRSKVADAFGALKTPHAFVVDRGQIVYSGGVDEATDGARAKQPFLKNALRALASGSKPEPARTRALGCVIKRP